MKLLGHLPSDEQSVVCVTWFDPSHCYLLFDKFFTFSVCSNRLAAAGDWVASEARRLPSVDTDVLAGLCGDVRKGSRGAANDSLGDVFGTFMCYPEASRSPRTGAELRRV